MKIARHYFVMALLSGFVPAMAEVDHETLNVYRSSGEIPPESLRNAAQLHEIAVSRGEVTLWLTTYVPFDPNNGELTAAQIAAQKKEVKKVFKEILHPLIVSGLVRRDPERPEVEGPGRSVIATAHGLARLVEDTRLLNISWTK